MSWLHSLFKQWLSKPHCEHRLGACSPHWQPPLTQHAQFNWWPLCLWCPLLCTVKFLSDVSCLSFTWSCSLSFHEHAQPTDFLVHRSTWPAIVKCGEGKKVKSGLMNYASRESSSIMHGWTLHTIEKKRKIKTYFLNRLESATTPVERRWPAAARSAIWRLTKLHDILLGFDAFESFHTCCKSPRTLIVKARLVHARKFFFFLFCYQTRNLWSNTNETN